MAGEEVTPALGKLSLAAGQHGGVVRGSIVLTQAGRLEVELLVGGASLATSHPAKVRVGRLLRRSVKAGKVSFSVSLSPAAKRALRRHHSLALIVKLTLTPSHGKADVVTHGVLVHA